MKHTIVFLLGTAREGRFSKKVADFVFACAQERNDIAPLFIDVSDFSLSGTQRLAKDKVQQWRDIVINSDAFIIIAPEYNHGYPGELKLLLDTIYDEYKGKVAAICSVSISQFGGVRMAEQLKLVLIALQMKVLNDCLCVANVQSPSFDSIDEKNAFKKRCNVLFDQVILQL